MQQLWQGETVERQDATGKTFKVRTLPKPLQPKLPIWITCQSPESFVEAGKIGANVLTSLLNGTLESLEPKIKLYRESLAEHGYEPQKGKVSLMVHTFL